jgi:phosphate starvation-inducible PhoH-like protein
MTRRKQNQAKNDAIIKSQKAVIDSTYNKRRIVDFVPKTEKQEAFVKNIKNSEISVGLGSAGVGKTYCVAAVAAQMLIDHKVDKIILTRANVTVGKTIGALPGTIEEKMTPLLMPILTALKRHLGEGAYQYYINKKMIEMVPAEYIRGLSFLDSFVIIDEAQNLTQEETKALITRYESGRVVLLGDPNQHDLKGTESGLVWLEAFVKRHKIGIPTTKFEIADVVRSELVKKFLFAIEADKKQGK